MTLKAFILLFVLLTIANSCNRLEKSEPDE